MAIKAVSLNTFGVLKQSRDGLSKPLQKNDNAVFRSRDYHPVNSKRERVDFGDRLYEGVNEYFGVRNAVFRTRAKAEYVDLNGKNLTNYCFAKSDLYKADMTDAILDYANFSNCNMWGASLRGAKIGDTIFDHANLCDAQFNDAKFSGNTTMTGANIMGADFRGTDLTDVDMTDAIYNETTIFPSGMPEDKFDNMILLRDGADFSLPQKPEDGKDELKDKRHRFDYAKIRFLTVKDVNFENNSLKRIDFKKSSLTNCNFKNAELARAYLKGTEINNCDFSGAKLKQVNFNDAQLTDVDMTRANLRGAILTYKSAENLNLTGAIYDQYTKFNDGFDPEKHGMIYEMSNLAVYNGQLLNREEK